jgi:hypothetical protein
LITGRRHAARALLLAALTVSALAVAPAPQPTATPHRINLSKLQSRALLPKQREHTEFIVEINKLGQVTRVRSGKTSKDRAFNTMTYGNVVQAFIRTPDGQVVLGTYRLSYDFDPQTGRVRRDVALVSRGGVNPNAPGAAIVILSHAHPHASPPAGRPEPIPSLDARALPDLKDILQASPTPGH